MPKSTLLREVLQTVGKKTSTALAQAGASASMNLRAARVATREKSDEFMTYISSEQFELDLDELGGRLGIDTEDLHSDRDAHWERVKHKTSVLIRHAALETMIGPTAIKLIALPKIGKRKALPWLGIVASGAAVARISYHCYQVFLSNKNMSSARTGS